MINVRERDQIWNCPENPIVSDDGSPDAIAAPGQGSGLPAPFPGIVTKEIDPGPPAPPTPTPPVPPGFYANQSFWVTATCGGSAPTNTVSYLVPAGIVIASTQAGANQKAYDMYYPLCVAQLNCSPVVVVAATPSDSLEVLGFDQEQFGGYWFSDPLPFQDDGFVVNM